jgi:hypothetical protein
LGSPGAYAVALLIGPALQRLIAALLPGTLVTGLLPARSQGPGRCPDQPQFGAPGASSVWMMDAVLNSLPPRPQVQQLGRSPRSDQAHISASAHSVLLIERRQACQNL